MSQDEDRVFDVRQFGARGDGRVLDTAAFNAAVAAAGERGGTVIVPPGRYLCFSIHLASGVTLLLCEGAVVEAADPRRHEGRYDLPERDAAVRYQDFGHSHWRNSLISGVGLRDVAIIGRGRIEGTGLTRDGPGARWAQETGERPLSMTDLSEAEIGELEPDEAAMAGQGNKAIALKDCRNVVLRDFTIEKGGHFAILATGVRDMEIEGLSIDTERDGIDLDCVRGARVRRCRVNTPNDDAIVLKSSLALGAAVPTEDVLIEDCLVSGYDAGTMLDGRFGRTQLIAPDRDRVTGRIKLGTESNGGFRGIRIRDCRFERSRGLALETVDGGTLEDVDISGVTMREVTSAPLFLRLGDRRRGPPGTGIGALRGIRITDIEATGVDPRFAATIAGLPNAPIRDVRLSNVRLAYEGGGQPSRGPIPLYPGAYPEPSMFGPTPAWGLWVRDAEDVAVDRLRLEIEVPDARPQILTERAGVSLSSYYHPTY